MEIAGFLTNSLWISILLVLNISAEIHPNIQSSHLSKTASVVRIKRQNSAEEWIETILHRMNDLEDELALSKSAVERLQGYLKTLGFNENVHEENRPKAEPPCGNGLVGEHETNWTPFGPSSCLKLMSGLFSFTNATGVCNQQYKIGEDLAHPVLVSVDSHEKARDLLHILRGQLGLSYVWADRKDTSPEGTVGLNCTELRIGGDNETEVELRAVQCERVSGVVCEKPMVVSYVEVVRKQLEGNKRVQTLEERLEKATENIAELGEERNEERRLRKEEAAKVTMVKLTQLESAVVSLEETARKAESEIRQLREEKKLLLNSFRTEFTEMVAQVESKSAETKTELRELRREKESLEKKLEELRTATTEDKRLRRVDEAEMRRLLKTLESETSLQLSTLTESSRRRQLVVDTGNAGIERRLEEMNTIGEAVEINLKRVDSAVKTLEVWKEETAGRVESLRTDLGGLGEQVGKLRSPDEESLKRLKISLQNPEWWQLGGIKRFDIQKAMGVWHRIEALGRSSKFRTDWKCEEDIFRLKENNTISYTNNYRYVSINQKHTLTFDIQVNSQYPHQWKPSDHNIWLKTDYDNWAITMECRNQSDSSCTYLRFLSRTRTLSSPTLDMLRGIAQTNGFPRRNGGLINQSSC